MHKEKIFIITALQNWNIKTGSNVKDIAVELSKNNKVLYLNNPKKQPKDYQTLHEIKQNLWVLDIPLNIFPLNKLPDGFIFDFFNRINQRRMYGYVKKQLSKIGFNNFILFIDNDIYHSFYANEFLSPNFSIYYRRDNMLNMDFWKKHAPRLEPLLCKKCTIVETNSAYLAEAVSFYNPRTYDVGQGVDLSAYDSSYSYSIPEDIKEIKRPILGYTGLLTSMRLDPQLIMDIAKERPGISIVLVGREDAVFEKHEMHNIPNIIFLGEKPMSRVPHYINAFDICFNPQKINKITIGNYPRKIDEYLALGKPTIGTKTETMKIFEKYVYLCTHLDDYLNAIDTILHKTESTTIKQDRINFAKSHSWENSVAAIVSHIDSY